MSWPEPGRLARLARPSGAFGMVALDQRESLRTILVEGAAVERSAIADATLRAFKVAAARALSPLASALLVDRDYGLAPILEAGALDPRCALLVAADRLTQLPGGPVEETSIDEGAVGPALAAGAIGLKLLVIWRDDGGRRRAAMVERFVRLCGDAGLISLVEGVVSRPPADRADGWDGQAAIVEAARELGATGCDLYKAEVPFHGQAEPDDIRQVAARITEAVGCPWVVLSQGVSPERFPAALEAACRGGASGFLAGRAIWSRAIGPRLDDGAFAAELGRVSVPALARLTEIMDAVARRLPASGRT